jgi:hypothetical protein
MPSILMRAQANIITASNILFNQSNTILYDKDSNNVSQQPDIISVIPSEDVTGIMTKKLLVPRISPQKNLLAEVQCTLIKDEENGEQISTSDHENHIE